MLAVSSATTLHLAVLTGAYMLAAGLGGFAKPKLWLDMLENFRANPGLTYLAGVVTFVIGAVMTVLHHHWSDPVAFLVSLFGFAALVEGMIALAFPQFLLRIAEGMLQFVRPFAIATMAVGAFLLIAGLAGTAPPVSPEGL